MPVESPEEFYREFEKPRLRIGDLGYNLIKLIEEYQRAGFPLGKASVGFRLWVQHRQWTTVN